MSSLVPFVIEQTDRGGERSVDIFSRLLRDRILLIGGVISDEVSLSAVAQLLFLKMEDSKKPVHVYINSPGGSLNAGLAIYDTMRFLGCPIATYCIGQAASMAAVLLAAGDVGHRFSLPNSRIMIHQPHGGVTGTSEDIHRQAREIGTLKDNLANIMANHTKKERDQILADWDRDFFMSADEAVTYGIIDKVLTPAQPA